MAFNGKTPDKGSAQWKKNEKIINSNPFLRGMREKSEGFSGTNTTGTGGWTPSEAYKSNWDAIFGKKDKDTNEDEK
jgi:hypothetical protein